ncbi:MAG: hypothetical protein ACYCW6_00110 [Candidatus Xenobia bacterium]
MSEEQDEQLAPRGPLPSVDVPGYTSRSITIDGHLPHLDAQVPVEVVRPDGTIATESAGLPTGFDGLDSGLNPGRLAGPAGDSLTRW